jgi:hypothetical protein
VRVVDLCGIIAIISMAKSKDKRIDEFRDDAMSFVAEHFEDMKTAFKAYIEKKDYDKAVALYMKMVDKVIPSLQTQSAESDKSNEIPAWKQKINKSKKTYENDTK